MLLAQLFDMLKVVLHARGPQVGRAVEHLLLGPFDKRVVELHDLGLVISQRSHGTRRGRRGRGWRAIYRRR